MKIEENQLIEDIVCNEFLQAEVEYFTRWNETIQIKQNLKIKDEVIAYPAYKQSLIILSDKKVSQIGHFNRQGILIKKIPFNITALVESIHLISDIELLLMISQYGDNKKYILQWNLKTNQIITFPILQTKSVKIEPKLMIFPQTQTFCLIEKLLDYKQIKISLKYFKYPLITGDAKPFRQFQTKAYKISNQKQTMFIKQINQHSGIMIKKQIKEQDDSQLFAIYDFRNQGNSIKLYKLNNCFQKQSELYFCQFIDIWQPAQGFIYFKYQITLKRSKLKTKLQSSKGNRSLIYQKANQYVRKQKTIHLVWDCAHDKINYLNIKKQQDSVVQFLNGLRQISRISCRKPVQSWLIFKGPYIYLQQNGYRIAIYYVSTSDWQVVTCNQSYRNYIKQNQQKYQNQVFLQYDNTLIKRYNIMKKEELLYINIQTVKLRFLPFNQKIIFTFILNQIIQNCDQDLLMVVSKLLETE